MFKMTSAIIGASGLALSVAAGNIDPSDVSDIAKAIVQVVIAVVTLIGLFRKRKRPNV